MRTCQWCNNDFLGKLGETVCSRCEGDAARLDEYLNEPDDTVFTPVAPRVTRKLTFSERLEWWAENANTSMGMRFYLAGLDGLFIPRKWRRLIARSKWHRAWLNGYMAIYYEGGAFYGVCQRDWVRSRKRPAGHADDNLWRIIKQLVAPWSRPVPN